MADYRFDDRDLAMWGRRLSGLGAEVFEHRDRLDDAVKLIEAMSISRTDDMVVVAELREACRMFRAELDELKKVLVAELREACRMFRSELDELKQVLTKEQELRDRQHKEHVALHGKLNARLQQRLPKLEPIGEAKPDEKPTEERLGD